MVFGLRAVKKKYISLHCRECTVYRTSQYPETLQIPGSNSNFCTKQTTRFVLTFVYLMYLLYKTVHIVLLYKFFLRSNVQKSISLHANARFVEPPETLQIPNR